jgi:hypothetical protein
VIPGDGPSWLTVIGHAKDSLWSVDLLRCESILLESYWIMVVMDVFTRRIIGFGVAPAERSGVPAQPIAYTWRQHCNGLFQTPTSA